MDKVLDVTSIEQLKKYSKGQVVELPPFAEDQPFVARLKRPSMLALAASGKIPNKLVQTANSLFYKGTVNSRNEKIMPETLSIFDILCEACFVEPTYAELKEANIELTDEQRLFIFQYSQKGVEALDNFRKKSADNISAVAGTTV